MSRILKPVEGELFRVGDGPGKVLAKLHRHRKSGIALDVFSIGNYARFGGNHTLRALAFSILDATGGRDGPLPVALPESGEETGEP